MGSPLLETKFHLPRRRRGLVRRPRLDGQLARGADSALTLVSAPAGFGKTTLLAEWLSGDAAAGRATAWLSLDERDNDPALFWRYLITALTTAVKDVGGESLSLLQSLQAPIETVISSLLNDLTAVPTEVVLVVDDYHLIEARAVQDGMAFLLEHLPRQLRLVIAGRADPALPLARLRARGELFEIRAADLRFTADEAAAYLNEVMGLALTAADVASLDRRTEGWIAALQLAALSMQGRDDVSDFIAGFAGDDRYIVDYLAEEVLNRQPEHIRQFLLETSILDRLSGPLCDAVTGRGGGRSSLEGLERGNLFVVPLDDRRQWYRYHRLFADVLQAHLMDEQPGGVSDLHRRASTWFELSGEPSDAIRHALAAKDLERAADLIEGAIPTMSRTRQEGSVRGWLDVLPDRIVSARPVLMVGFAGALLSVGEIEGVEERLRQAERWLTGPTDTAAEQQVSSERMVVVDEDEFRRLPRLIELYRAALSLARFDLPGTVRHAGRAVQLSAPDDHLGRAAASGLLGLALWTEGDLQAGHGAYAQCMAGLYRAGYVADTFGCAVALADIRLTQGRLGAAIDTYELALRRATELSGPVLRGTADMHVGMSEIYRERNDMTSATAHLLRSQELGEEIGLPQNRYRRRVAMARIRQSEGDLPGALDLLNEAEHHYVSDFFPNVRPIPALRTRVWIAQGALAKASRWAQERGLTMEDGLDYLHEFDHVTLARLTLATSAAGLAMSSMEGVTQFLRRLLEAAEQGGRTGSVIEILVVQALAQQAQGNRNSAADSVDRALTLAEPEGYVRIFADEGPAMAALLAAASKKGISAGYARRLLTAFPVATSVPPDQKGVIDPLSARELDVLRLLGTDLDGPRIARELIVSLNTVRTHTKSIYAKLGVNNRRAAVRRAQELDLMSRDRGHLPK